MVENALAKAIPVAISFLASLLGLGGISKKVREIIEAVRGKIDNALDAVFNSKPVQMVGGFIRKVVDKVKNVAKAGVGKVKSLAAAGASKVKGAAKAGVGKVKAGVTSGVDKLKSSVGQGPEKAGAPSATESEQSVVVKSKARQLVHEKTKRPFQSQQEANQTLGQIKQQLQPQGLKSLKLQPQDGQPGKFSVIAEASPGDKVGDINIEDASKPSVARRIESVEEAQAAREQWILEGKAYRQSLKSQMYLEEWLVGMQQKGQPPPAYVDSAGVLVIDVSRVGWMSSERLAELRSRSESTGAGPSASQTAPSATAPTATRETRPPMPAPSTASSGERPTVELPAAGPATQTPSSSETPTLELPAVGASSQGPSSSETPTMELPAVGSTPRAGTSTSGTPTAPNMPAVGGGDQPRLVEKIKTSNHYFVYDSSDPKQRLKAEGELKGNGLIVASIRAKIDGKRSKLIRGAEQFDIILAHFGSARGFEASWQYGDNLAKFNELTAKGIKPEEAALQTWTGQQCQRHGFAREVKIVETSPKDSPGAYKTVKVHFLK